jgi:hypothetical protein
MDSADSTLALKVLGELDDNGEPAGAHTEGGVGPSHCMQNCVLSLTILRAQWPSCTTAMVQLMHCQSDKPLLTAFNVATCLGQGRLIPRRQSSRPVHCMTSCHACATCVSAVTEQMPCLSHSRTPQHSCRPLAFSWVTACSSSWIMQTSGGTAGLQVAGV